MSIYGMSYGAPGDIKLYTFYLDTTSRAPTNIVAFWILCLCSASTGGKVVAHPVSVCCWRRRCMVFEYKELGSSSKPLGIGSCTDSASHSVNPSDAPFRSPSILQVGFRAVEL